MGSGFKTFTAGAVLTASEVNNYLMEQSIPVFATTAARDAAITSPEAGMVCYINSNDANEGLYFNTAGTVGSWYKGASWNMPWGLLGKASLGTQSATSGTHTTNQDGSAISTITLTTVTNRNYKVTTTHHLFASGGANTIIMRHVVGGVIQSTHQHVLASAAIINSFTFKSSYTETAGASRIFKVQIQASPTNTEVSDYGDAAGSYFRTIAVEDIGPSGAPA